MKRQDFEAFLKELKTTRLHQCQGGLGENNRVCATGLLALTVMPEECWYRNDDIDEHKDLVVGYYLGKIPAKLAEAYDIPYSFINFIQRLNDSGYSFREIRYLLMTMQDSRMLEECHVIRD